MRILRIAHFLGLSKQDTEYQRDASERLHLPFPLLSDERLCLASTMRLPTFETAGMKLPKRLTLVIRDGVIQHTFYPLFPSDRSAAEVVTWFKSLDSTGPGTFPG